RLHDGAPGVARSPARFLEPTGFGWGTSPSRSTAEAPLSCVLVLSMPDAVPARLAAAELGDTGIVEIRVLQGGTEAWRAAGLPLTAEAMAGEPNNAWRRLRSLCRRGGPQAVTALGDRRRPADQARM